MPDRLRSQYHLILAQLGLPELLRYEDRNSMAHSLEGRVPFLDHRLVELLYGLDARQLYERGTTKIVLRRALSDLLPPAVRERPDKLGFVTPERASSRPRSAISPRTVFSLARASRARPVDADEALERLKRHRAGSPAGSSLARAQRRALGAKVPGMRVLTIVGNRPQFIKAAPLSLALADAGIDEVSLHSGQHYDAVMSEIFYDAWHSRADALP